MAYSLICANIPIELTYIIDNFTDQQAINMGAQISKIVCTSRKFSKDREPLIGSNNIDCVDNPEMRTKLFTRKYMSKIENKFKKYIIKMNKFLKELSIGNNADDIYNSTLYQIFTKITNEVNNYIVTNKKYNSLNQHLISKNLPTLQNIFDQRLMNLINNC